MKNINKFLIFLFILAFLVRVIGLNQSLWLDEATTARVIKEYGFFEILTKFSPFDFHPPLYYLLLKLWTNVFGYSEVALRLPSVIFSVLTGWLVYLITRMVFPVSSAKGGVFKAEWAAFFFLFNPLIMYYSQEARMYMMVTFFLTMSLYFCLLILAGPVIPFLPASAHNKNLLKFGTVKDRSLHNLMIFRIASMILRAVGSPSRYATHFYYYINIFLFIICNIISLLTFYGSIFLIIPLYLYLLYKKKFKFFFVSCFLFLVIFLMLSPLLYKQILNAKSSLQIVANWEQVLGQVNLKNLILIPIKFVSGRISFYPKALYYLIAGGWTVIVWFFVFTGGLKKKAFLFLLFAPLVLGLLFSFFTPFFSYFRFIYLIPVMTILIAAGAKTPVNRLIIAVGMIGFSLVYLLNSNYYREDWKNLAKNLPKNELIYIIPSSADPLKYYRNNLSLINLTNFETDHNRQAFLISQQIKKMTVIPYAADIYGIEYKKILTTNRFALNNIKTFRGLTIESWIRSDL